MAFADPTLVKDAVNVGTLSGGLIDGKACVLTAGAWDVVNGPGDTMSRPVFGLIKAGTVNEDFTITTSAGTFQLVSQDGRANLIDP